MPGSYPDEFRQRALRMLSEARSDHKTDHAVIKHVAGKLGVNAETLRLWKKRLDVDEGRQPGPPLCGRTPSRGAVPSRGRLAAISPADASWHAGRAR